jgi:hypothetical protein
LLEDHARDHAHQGWVGQAASDPRRSGCPRCADGGRCRSCAQRRKHAWRLVEQRGLSYERAAARMRLTPGQVRLLVFRERDHQELKRFKLDLIPTERVRGLIERELERDPLLSRAELAVWMDMPQIELDRRLGYAPGKDGRRQRRIGIELASRIVIALGRAPVDLDGC